jgi:L-ascorbate metabolism protein UlaG (beta-lactamase superfamily)
LADPVRITHLGHSCVLVEASGQRILIDPGVFSHGFEELTGLSAVLITHEHQDHLDISRLPTLLEANDGAAVHAEPETAVQLLDGGFEAGKLHVGSPVTVGGVTVTPLGGSHALIHPDIPQIGNVGLLIEADGEPRLFVPGDSYAATPEGIDLLAVPLSGPWSSGATTIDFARAVGAPVMIPVHDELLSAPGRGLLVGLVDRLTPDHSRMVDLRGAGATEF